MPWASGGFDTAFNGDCDAFVAKLSSAGGHLWSTYLGGSGYDWSCGVAADGAGDVREAVETVREGLACHG